MAVKFGPGGNSESFYAEGFKSTLQAPAWVRDRGLDAYEYQGGNGITASAKTLSAIGEAAAGQGISMSLHTPYYISLSSEFEEKRAKSLDYIAASADACEALGARIMVVHTGSAAKLSRETAMAYACRHGGKGLRPPRRQGFARADGAGNDGQAEPARHAR